MTKLMKDVFNLPLRSHEPPTYGNGPYPVISCNVGCVSPSGIVAQLTIKQGTYTGTGKYLSGDVAESMAESFVNAVNNHDTLTEQNKQLVDILSRVNDNYQQNLTKRSGGEPVDFGTDGEVNRVWVEVPLLKEIESFLAKHKEQI